MIFDGICRVCGGGAEELHSCWVCSEFLSLWAFPVLTAACVLPLSSKYHELCSIHAFYCLIEHAACPTAVVIDLCILVCPSNTSSLWLHAPH